MTLIGWFVSVVLGLLAGVFLPLAGVVTFSVIGVALWLLIALMGKMSVTYVYFYILILVVTFNIAMWTSHLISHYSG